MPQFPWHDAYGKVQPYVVKISAPNAYGTGFLFAYPAVGLAAIATAAHVVEHAHAWGFRLRIDHLDKSLLLKEPERAIFIDNAHDTAAIVFSKGDLTLPEDPLDLISANYTVKEGSEIGWIGFPALSPSQLCLFSGRVSSLMVTKEAYLVDGVAINGVSGGPAFHLPVGGGFYLIGVVSAYVPNRATGEPLPGLSIVSDVCQLQEMIKWFKSLNEAKNEETPPRVAQERESSADDGSG